MTIQNKKLLVSAIKDGTVIDRIESGNALKVIHFLNIIDSEKIITVGLNLPSKVMGKKDLVKIENLELTTKQINDIAILAPNATINIIKKYKVIKKFKAEIPDYIHNIVTCPNPKCITNNENIITKFDIINKKNPIKIKCNYCEKIFEQNDILNYKHT